MWQENIKQYAESPIEFLGETNKQTKTTKKARGMCVSVSAGRGGGHRVS